MADHSKPVMGEGPAAFVAGVDARFDDITMWLDSATTSPTNLPSGAKRWNSSEDKFEKWDGSAWSDLTSMYKINTEGEISGASTFEDPAATRAALGLGTGATRNTGTSGATVPLLDGDNTYSGTSTFTGDRQTMKLMSLGAGVSHQITSGAIALTASHVQLVGEGNTTDQLDDITGGSAGDIVIIRNTNAYTITVVDSATIALADNFPFIMDNSRDVLVLKFTGGVWVEMSRRDNA